MSLILSSGVLNPIWLFTMFIPISEYPDGQEKNASRSWSRLVPSRFLSWYYPPLDILPMAGPDQSGGPWLIKFIKIEPRWDTAYELLVVLAFVQSRHYLLTSAWPHRQWWLFIIRGVTLRPPGTQQESWDQLFVANPEGRARETKTR